MAPALLEFHRIALEWLSERDALIPPVADAVIGFGVFDLRVARRCGEHVIAGRAKRIIFTGGFGAGTAGLTQPEADAFHDEVVRTFPALANTQIILENRSTNTGDNLRFTAELLRTTYPGYEFGRGLRRVIAVAGLSRLRRVALTMAKQFPSVQVLRDCPDSDLATETQLYAEAKIDFSAHLAGELDRILTYPERGWTTAISLPADVAAAHTALKAFLANRQNRLDPTTSA